nr:MAG TPA: hypothetical protein [Caudoviricetes sp.]
MTPRSRKRLNACSTNTRCPHPTTGGRSTLDVAGREILSLARPFRLCEQPRPDCLRPGRPDRNQAHLGDRQRREPGPGRRQPVRGRYDGPLRCALCPPAAPARQAMAKRPNDRSGGPG